MNNPGQMNNPGHNQLTMVINHTEMGIAKLNMKGCFETVSSVYLDITGYQKEQLINQNILLIIPDINKTRFENLFSELANGMRKSFSIQIPFITPDDSTKWILFSATLDNMETKDTAQIISVIHDISEQKQQQEQEYLSSLAFSHSGDGIMITNAKHTIICINPAFSKISGFNENEMIGRKPFLLRSGEHDETFYNRIWKTLELEGLWQGEICYRHKSGRLFYVWETISAVTDKDDNLLHYISILADMTEIKERQKVLNDLANYDTLTELPNRHYLEANLTQSIEDAKHRGDKVALLFIDLNKFKPINDQYGHKAGDVILMEVAHQLSMSIRQEDTAARIGGDEFVILMPKITRREVVEGIAERVHQSIQKPTAINDKIKVSVSSSIGISLYPDDLNNLQDNNNDAYQHLNQESEILELADHAMYVAKENQLNICFFDQINSLSDQIVKRMT